jgi:hypothetical protein
VISFRLLRPTVFLRHDHGAGRRCFLAYRLISGGNMYDTDSCCLFYFRLLAFVTAFGIDGWARLGTIDDDKLLEGSMSYARHGTLLSIIESARILDIGSPSLES